MTAGGPSNHRACPTAADKGLTRTFGRTRGELSDALDRIKQNAGLTPDTDTLVDAQGNVSIDTTGEWIGNLIDEA